MIMIAHPNNGNFHTPHSSCAIKVLEYFFNFNVLTHAIGIVDEIWVPSQWNADLMARLLSSSGTLNPQIFVIPEAVDPTIFDPTLYHNCSNGSKRLNRVNDDHTVSHASYDPTIHDPRKDIPQAEAENCPFQLHQFLDNVPPLQSSNNLVQTKKKFIFLSIFKWEYRKGWDLLLSAYWQTFNESFHRQRYHESFPHDSSVDEKRHYDDRSLSEVLLNEDIEVELWIRSYVPAFKKKFHNTTDIMTLIKEYAQLVFQAQIMDLPTIKIISNEFSRQQMRDLYHLAGTLSIY
jgi:hypothetical protein